MRGRPPILRQQWLPFIGRRLGLARGLSYLLVDPDDFDIHHCFPIAAALGELLDDPRDLQPRAGGAGISLDDAVDRAMGEFLERYASLAYQGSGRIVASFNTLIRDGYRAVPFEILALFTGEQLSTSGFPYTEFTKDTPVAWFEGTDLLTGLCVHVPGQLIALGFVPGADEVSTCFYPTSSGCALGTSMDGALVAAVLECIERDAAMVRWYSRLPPPVLGLSAEMLLGPRLGRQSLGLEIGFYDMTVDGEVPVVGARITERTGRPCRLIIGTSAGVDIQGAARKALLEAGQGRPFVKLLAARGAPSEDGIFDNFDSNVRFFAEPMNARYVDWFLSSPGRSERLWSIPADASTPDASLQILLKRCARMGLTPIAFDMTTPDLRHHGLSACRVFVPELVPLGIPSAPFLGHPRLSQFIAKSEEAGLLASLPPWLPHPFA
jgi:thiazole/oxazole-forming peptide maturase SagD family component